MPEKTDKEIAAELTIAMLNHNASLHNGIVGQGQGQSKGNIVNGNTVGSNYAYLLKVVQGDIDPLKKSDK
ncbi:hypothetical protein [Lactiplantibacillus plantarum]|uniref:hypothetical protein n=1 Tax=Lactiplantibacillus plantarum TaxID=1590 RepID=UPI000976B7F8|nr:hypothetical protein [Lactiplantibacillus plantarum]QJY42129.1 hypothetical protein HPB53_03960 [Lactiplantibacillus plantarum]